MFNTKITRMLGIQYPILCGGMQWISRAEFVAAVCNAGAMGFISAESLETPKDLRMEIRKMRDLTDQPFGVNISMIPELGPPVRSLAFCDVVCEEGVKIVETAGRSPEPLMPKLKAAGIKVIHKLTSVRHALAAEKLGVDAVTLVGYGSGGHIGLDNIASFILIPSASERLEIPVIAGGSIGTGAGFVAALALGAEAVLMGTAFFATRECPVHPVIKERLVQAAETDTMLILNSIKNPIRCMRNGLARECAALEDRGADFKTIIGKVAGKKGKEAYRTGDTESGIIPCGQAVGLITGIKSVQEFIQGIISEARIAGDRIDALMPRAGSSWTAF
ncbi:MAG: NAD(P)H-dependent flavin oxidoreductase [Desulfatiglandales bacterium]